MKGYVNIKADRVIRATLNRKTEFERLESAFDKFKSDRKSEEMWAWLLFIPYKTNNYKEFCVVPFDFNYKEIKKRWPNDFGMVIKYANFKYAVNARQIRKAAKEAQDGIVKCNLELAQFVNEWADFQHD